MGTVREATPQTAHLQIAQADLGPKFAKELLPSHCSDYKKLSFNEYNAPKKILNESTNKIKIQTWTRMPK